MIINMAGGGGKSGVGSLNVVRYSSNTTQPPSNAKENDVAVITDTNFENVVVSIDQPGSVSYGTVWMQLGTGGVNIIVGKQKDIVLSVKTVRQYTNGSWNVVPAFAYLNGNWVSISKNPVYFYNFGDECSAITGGWTKNESQSPSSFDKNADNIFLDGNVSIRTNNMIDVTEFSTLCIGAVTGSVDGRTKRFGLTKTKDQLINLSTWLDADITIPANYTGASSLDVRSMSGSYYVVVAVRDGSEMTIYSVWGE